MEFYDNRDNFRPRTHTIRVTFQTENYVGHIAYEMGGNCQGLDVIDFDPDNISQDEIDSYTENDCNLSFDEDDEFFRITLTNPDGEQLQCEREDEDFKNLIVAIEIINCKIDKSEEK